MVTEDWVKLNSIKLKFLKHNISLQEIKELYFQAKQIYNDRLSFFDANDTEISLSVFKLAFDRVGEFWDDWQTKKLTPTDEELNLLEEAFTEGSWVFNQLATNFPNSFSTQDNQTKQEMIEKNIKIVASEKERRKNCPNLSSNFPQQSNHSSVKNNESNGNSRSPLEIFCWGLGIGIFIALIVYLIMRARNKYK